MASGRPPQKHRRWTFWSGLLQHGTFLLYYWRALALATATSAMGTRSGETSATNVMNSGSVTIATTSSLLSSRFEVLCSHRMLTVVG